MKKVLICVLLILGLFTISGCSNSSVTQFGGTKTIDIPDGMKFVHYNISANDIWCTYRPMRENEIPETYVIKQSKNIGLLGNGTIIIYEYKDGKKSEEIEGLEVIEVGETKTTITTQESE